MSESISFEEASSVIANFIGENYNLDLDKKKNLIVSGQCFTPAKFISFWANLNFLKQIDLKLAVDVMGSNFDLKILSLQIYESLVRKAKGDAPKVDPPKVESSLEEYGFKNVALYVDVFSDNSKSNKHLFFVNTLTNRIDELTRPEVLRTFLKLPTPLPATRKYLPFLINETLEDSLSFMEHPTLSEPLPVFNTCLHPSWRYNRDRTQKLTQEELHFIATCFADEDSLQYFIDAAYETIVGKMTVYVLMVGARGTGKTKLVEILASLVGENNSFNAPANALKSNFNGFYENKRLIYFDEHKANDDVALNTLKRDSNAKISVEKKGVDVYNVENFNSRWFTANKESDYSLYHDDRNFSAPNMTKDKIEKRGITKEWMGEFTRNRINTNEFKNAFFNYLEENRNPNFNPHKPFNTTDTFKRIVWATLSEWQKEIVRGCVECALMGIPQTTIGRLLAEINERGSTTKVPSRIDTVKVFCEDFEWEWQKLGTFLVKRQLSNCAININPLLKDCDLSLVDLEEEQPFEEDDLQ